MLTPDEVKTVSLFSMLELKDLVQLARTSEDIHLCAGEFAVHEGGERALFAVLSGRIEVIKLFDGIERRLGWRLPGTIFGEVPIALGTPFPGAYRAAEPSRIMRIDTRHYYALAALCPEVAARVGALARERLGGLQGIAAQPSKPRVIIVGQRWDTSCSDLRRFLARNQIVFDWLTPDSPELASRWPGSPPRNEDCPVLLADGTVTQPTARELARALGLQTTARLDDYDTVIVGGGPAGLAAAVYGASEGLRTLVVEREAPGGQAGTSARIENYLGFPGGVSGDELASRALQQARRLGAARSEAETTNGLDIYLIGAGNSAGQAALHFANYARTVTLVVRGSSLEKTMSQYLIEQLRGKSNIAVKLQSEVQAIHGETSLTAIDIREQASNSLRRYDCGGLFVFIGADADTNWLPGAIARNSRGYVLTGSDVLKNGSWSHSRDPYLLESSVPGIFACGDVRLSPIKRVASAVGEGSMAIAFVHQYLQRDAASSTEPRVSPQESRS